MALNFSPRLEVREDLNVSSVGAPRAATAAATKISVMPDAAPDAIPDDTPAVPDAGDSINMDSRDP